MLRRTISGTTEKGLAGKDWLYGFLKRTPQITLRQPEGTSLNRIALFNTEAVQTFYSNLRTLMENIKFKANRIFNIDETGITTIQTKCPKVYGPKGAKKVGAAISGERRRTLDRDYIMEKGSLHPGRFNSTDLLYFLPRSTTSYFTVSSFQPRHFDQCWLVSLKYEVGPVPRTEYTFCWNFIAVHSLEASFPWITDKYVYFLPEILYTPTLIAHC
ncbi:hypothetical protein NQ318_023504 [Aromia moschata]|uniref:Transposase n=1 Tax=Aromia moschata TaxID=1265417 RepID=A0AAV8YRD3_9CUCU|nr:hypothetical protein NQ318_023504 [Aromia moschata]